MDDKVKVEMGNYIDVDTLRGRKSILIFLSLSDWAAVMARKEKTGLPVAKVCGRWEMSISDYRIWRTRLTGGNVEEHYRRESIHEKVAV